jgi:hypothetical protein
VLFCYLSLSESVAVYDRLQEVKTVRVSLAGAGGVVSAGFLVGGTAEGGSL